MLFVTLPYQTSQHLKQISENTTNHLKQEVNRITLCIKKATDVALNHHGYYRGLYSSKQWFKVKYIQHVFSIQYMNDHC